MKTIQQRIKHHYDTKPGHYFLLVAVGGSVVFWRLVYLAFCH